MRRAKLRMHLKEVLIAYELDAVVDVVNETYTSLRWLELAESNPGPQPYGDSTFAYDEFLRVRRVEIGTPNFIELYGLADTLSDTLIYLSAFFSFTRVGKMADLAERGAAVWHRMQLDRLERRRERWKLEHERLELERKMREFDAEAERAKIADAKLGIQVERARAHPPEEIVAKAKRLNVAGKVSLKVVEYKSRRQEALREKLGMLHGAIVDLEFIPDND